MKLLGYTMEQWAIVFGRYPLEEASISGIAKCRKQWQLNHSNEPGEVSIVGCAPKKDFASVEKILGLQWQTSINS